MRNALSIAMAAMLVAACGGGTNDVPATPSADTTNAGTDASSAGTDVSNSSSSAAFCDSISGGGAKVSSSVDSGCIDCSVTNADAAADGDLSTFASVDIGVEVPTQGVSIRATAQSGMVFPAGNNATVAFTANLSGTNLAILDTGTELRTYLGGVLQESANNLQEYDCKTCGPGSKPYSAVSFQTTKQFDAVEIFMDPGTNSSGLTGPNFQVFEICSNSGH